MPPVRRHLTSMRVWIVFSADAGKELLVRSHSQLQTERTISIVRIEPIVASLQSHACCYQHCFVSGTTDLKVDPVLGFKLNLFVVDSSRHIHRAIHLNENLAIRQLLALRLCDGGFHGMHRFRAGHRWRFRGFHRNWARSRRCLWLCHLRRRY